jgi:hypothetical protein
VRIRVGRLQRARDGLERRTVRSGGDLERDGRAREQRRYVREQLDVGVQRGARRVAGDARHDVGASRFAGVVADQQLRDPELSDAVHVGAHVALDAVPAPRIVGNRHS